MAKRLKQTVFIINDYLFEQSINVVFTNDINRAVKLQCRIQGISIEKEYLVDEGAAAMVLNVDTEKYKSLWCVFDTARINEGIIVHECVHIATSVLLPRGIKHLDKTDEIWAYTIQFFFNKIKSYYYEK